MWIALLVYTCICIAPANNNETFIPPPATIPRLDSLDDARASFQTIVSQPGFANVASASLVPLELHVCNLAKNLFNGFALAALMRVGEFEVVSAACEALAAFRPDEWLKIPMIDLEALTNPRGHPLAIALMKEYIDLNRDLCGFSKLPVGLQRKYSQYFRHDPRFVMTSKTLPDGSVQHTFTSSPPGFSYEHFTFDSLTESFGILKDTVDTTWIYDTHKKCVASLLHPELQLLPDFKLAAEVTEERKLRVFWPTEEVVFDSYALDDDGYLPATHYLTLSASPAGNAFYLVEIAGDQEAVLTGRVNQSGLTLLSDEVSVIEIDGDFARVVSNDHYHTVALCGSPLPGNPYPFKFNAGLEDLTITDFSMAEFRQYLIETCLEFAGHLADFAGDKRTDHLRDICAVVLSQSPDVAKVKQFAEEYMQDKSSSLWNVRDIFIHLLTGKVVQVVPIQDL